MRERLSARAADVDRRLPVHPRYLAALVAAAVIAAAVLTSGFGIFGGDDSGLPAQASGEKPEKVEVAVLNATQVDDTVTGEPIAGVQGLAGVVAKKVVKPAGFKIGVKADATVGLRPDGDHVRARKRGRREQARRGGQRKSSARPEVTPMIGEVRDLAEKAPLALVIGADDADFGAGS